MKATLKILYLFAFVSFIMFTNGCSEDSEDVYITENIQEQISILQKDKEALLFMLEEEKLARDTYQYLNEKWNMSQFANIKNSEQTHMNAIETLLQQYKVSYTILPEGVFSDPELQTLYNTFKVDGEKSVIAALQIGATIEDLDIKDLETFISDTENTQIINVYQSLQCGSRNHLRSFMQGLATNGGDYTQQFITEAEFNTIINGSHEQCN